jgi:hypothetical protein
MIHVDHDVNRGNNLSLFVTPCEPLAIALTTQQPVFPQCDDRQRQAVFHRQASIGATYYSAVRVVHVKLPLGYVLEPLATWPRIEAASWQ